ncbi:riboflavin biosynthesis protein RibD [Sphingomonas hengshuiensis]|uniref:Riboflavin biosynthesis protein RibD n=2 Tax=Sphingomonas hengshuiensis TaxID=1609977 RepID=A0A7U5CV85_9SPHN|nr:riboflavin biosynthesis protein RibD [Sphingomonas hengshuiensis]
MAAALALSQRGRGRTAPNPNVGCVIVADGRVVGRGWTQPGGRPHAEAMALAQAGDRARGATCYVTLEPCAHDSARGPACADLLIAAGVGQVVVAIGDPDPRTDGLGIARLRDAGIAVEPGVLAEQARGAMAGFLTRRAQGRPFVTLKLATSLDGRIALPSGESRWITGPQARAHAHLERARNEAILVGRGTWEIDRPTLDVRLPGLEARSPRVLVLSSSGTLRRPDDIAALENVDHLLVEGGAETAAAFVRAGLVDRLLLYRAPILLGAGKPALGDLGLVSLASAHGRWRLSDTQMLGSDRVEVYAAN